MLRIYAIKEEGNNMYTLFPNNSIINYIKYFLLFLLIFGITLSIILCIKLKIYLKYNYLKTTAIVIDIQKVLYKQELKRMKNYNYFIICKYCINNIEYVNMGKNCLTQKKLPHIGSNINIIYNINNPNEIYV